MNVTISFCSAQTVDDERTETAFTTTGVLEMTSDGKKLCYQEPPQEGVAGADVTITVRGTKLLIERRGETTSQMILEKNKRHICRYDTPYGRLILYTIASYVAFDFQEGAGQLTARYTLDMNHAVTAQEIEIQMREVIPC